MTIGEKRFSQRVDRPWGHYVILQANEVQWIKLIVVYPHSALSLQTHEKRTEHWYPLDQGLEAYISHGGWVDLVPGVEYVVPMHAPHRVLNATNTQASFLEIAIGQPEEDDIIRYEDNYGRATRRAE